MIAPSGPPSPPGWHPGTTPATHAPTSVLAMNPGGGGGQTSPAIDGSQPGGGHFFYMRGGKVHRKSFQGGGAPADSGAAPAGPAVGSPDYIWQGLHARGFNDAQAAAAMGNMQQESSLNANAVNRGEGAHGYIQWEGDRMNGPNGLGEFARQTGRAWNDPDAQMDFLAKEITSGGIKGSKEFMAANDVGSANAALRHYIGYKYDQEEPHRLANSERFAQTYGGGGSGGAAAPNVPAAGSQEVQATAPSYGGGFKIPGTNLTLGGQQPGGQPPFDWAGYLMNVGAGMMSSRSPHFGTAMGEGLTAGNKYLMDSQELAQKWQLNQAQINNMTSEQRSRDMELPYRVQQLQIQSAQSQLNIAQTIAAFNAKAKMFGFQPIDPAQYGLPPLGGQHGTTDGQGGASGGVGPTQGIHPLGAPGGAPVAAGAPSGAPSGAAPGASVPSAQAQPVASPAPPGAAPAGGAPPGGGRLEDDPLFKQGQQMAQYGGMWGDKDALQYGNDLMEKAQKRYEFTHAAEKEGGVEGAKLGQQQNYEEDQNTRDAQAAHALQIQRLDTMRRILQSYKTGTWAEEKADFVGGLQSLGLDVPSNWRSWDVKQYQEFTKNAIQQVYDQLRTIKGQPRNMEISGLTTANPSAKLVSGANADIISQLIGLIRYQDQYNQDWANYRNTDAGQQARSPLQFQNEWLRKNDPQRFVDQARKEFSYRGQSIPAEGERPIGQHYMTPKGERIWTAQGWAAP